MINVNISCINISNSINIVHFLKQFLSTKVYIRKSRNICRKFFMDSEQMNYHLFYTNISNLCPFLVVNVSKSFWYIQFINYNKTSRGTRRCSGIYHSARSSPAADCALTCDIWFQRRRSRVALCNNFRSKFIFLYTLLRHSLDWWLLLLQLNILSRQCFF